MSSQKRAWQRNKINQNFETYKEKRNEYFREIRRLKQTTWNLFLENV
jgi:uncharacterized coiled-coil DUF342 family protein